MLGGDGDGDRAVDGDDGVGLGVVGGTGRYAEEVLIRHPGRWCEGGGLDVLI